MTLAKKDMTEEQKRQAAALLGSIKTEKKAAASARNGFKPGNTHGKNGGRKPAPIGSIPCNCSGGDSTEASAHTWRCARGQALRRREAQGRDAVTGEKLGAA